MRWLGWLLVAVLAVGGVGAACGGGAPEREVGSQRPVEQEAGSQRDASAGGASSALAGASSSGDDRRTTPAGAAPSSSEGVRGRVVVVDPVADERAARRSSSDAAGSGGVSAGGVVVREGGATRININVSPMAGGLAFSGPNDIPPLTLLLQLPAGAYNCAVEVDRPAPDEAEGQLVVTFADFDESGSEATAETSGPEWSGAAQLEVVESADEDGDEETPTRALPGMGGLMSGRQLTATIVSDLQDGMWTINCRLVEE